MGKKYQVKYQGHTITAREGDNLRSLLLKEGLSPYKGMAKVLNCHGLGSCGTCAIRIKGDKQALTKMEKWRLNFPPHKAENKLRLACQYSVNSDLELEKHSGFWGQKANK